MPDKKVWYFLDLCSVDTGGHIQTWLELSQPELLRLQQPGTTFTLMREQGFWQLNAVLAERPEAQPPPLNYGPDPEYMPCTCVACTLKACGYLTTYTRSSYIAAAMQRGRQT